MACPDLSVLARLATTGLSEDEAAGLEAHLAACAPCRMQAAGRLEEAWQTLGEPAPQDVRQATLLAERLPALLVSQRSHRRPLMRVRPAAVAAAGFLVLAAGAAWLWRTPGGPSRAPVDSPFPAGREITGVSETFQIGSGTSDTVHLPDGTRLRLGERTRARFRPPAAGERHCLLLESGEVEASVGKGSGAFRVVHPSGTVEVLGTRFRAWTASIPGPAVLAGLEPVEAVGVEVYEGRIRLSNGSGAALVRPGERAISLPGEEPSRQEQTGTSETMLASFARLLDWRDGRVRVVPGRSRGAALLLAVLEGMSRSSAALEKPLFGEDLPPALAPAAEAASRALRLHPSPEE